MSRISAPADRPIPTNEPKLATQQTSETESVQKTDKGKAILDAEQPVKQNEPPSNTKGAQYESRLGGLARESEMQSHFPIPSAPVLKDLPDIRPNINPNVHLDEKIDVTKNLPVGKEINKGLDGLDWGLGKAKTGPSHFGVDMTYGGMKAPTDRIAEVLNGVKPTQPNNSASDRDARMVEKTGGVAGQIRSPKYDQISQTGGGSSKNAKSGVVADLERTYDKNVERVKTVVRLVLEDAPSGDKAIEALNLAISIVHDPLGDDKEPTDDKKYVDGDAAGVNYVPSSEEIARFVKTGLGHVEHGINPDLGVGGGHIAPKAEDIKDPMDRVKYPIDGDASAVEDSPKRGTLATEIHGPRTLNPDAGYEPPKAGDIKPRGPDPLTGNPSE